MPGPAGVVAYDPLPAGGTTGSSGCSLLLAPPASWRIPEGAGPCQGGFERGFLVAGACVTGVSCSPIAADVCGEWPGRSRTGAPPSRHGAAPEASLRWPAGSPVIWRGEREPVGPRRRAVRRGQSDGRPAARGGGQNSLRPRAWRGAECLAASRLAAGQGQLFMPPAPSVPRAGRRVASGSGSARRASRGKTRVSSWRAAATLAMFLASFPRRAMMAALTPPITLSRGTRWMASISAQRSSRDPCLVTCPRHTLVSESR